MKRVLLLLVLAASHASADPASPWTEGVSEDTQARAKGLLAGRVGEIEATCTQPSAHVLLDGRPWFDCPGTKKERVLAGAHAIVGQRDGFLTSSQRLFVTGGTTERASVQLVSLDAAVKLE